MDDSFSPRTFQMNGAKTIQYTKSPRKKGLKGLMVIIVILLILGLIVFGAMKITSPQSRIVVPSPTPTSAVLPTDTPTPTPPITTTPSPTSKVSPTPTTVPTGKITPTPTTTASGSSIDSATGLDRASISVTVQNGSGTSGVAGKGSDYLKGLGYKVAGTGNADNFNYTNVTINTTPAAAKYLNLLKSDLSKQYTVDTATSTLSSTTADVVVIIGK